MGHQYKIFRLKRRNLHIKNNAIKIRAIFILIIFLSILFNLSAYAETSSSYIDTDLDGIPNEYDTDDDGDSFSDTIEIDSGTDPLDNTSHPPILPIDTDGDDLPDSIDPDDDNDGLLDVDELINGTDPKHFDTDNDWLFDYQELKFGTDPLKKDTDNDKYLDNDEKLAGTDPLNSSSYPTTVLAFAGPDKIVYPNERVILDSIFSIGKLLNHSWDFDASDGIQVDAIGSKVEHVFTKEGIYTVTLTVTDGNSTDTDTTLVIVDSKLAAQIYIERYKEINQINYEKEVDLKILEKNNNSITLEISGNISTNAVVIISIDVYTLMLFEFEEIVVKYDGKLINHTTLTNVITASGNEPIYNLSRIYREVQFTIFIPKFSTHKINIERVEDIDKFELEDIKPPEDINYLLLYILILVLIILVIFSFIGYSYKKSEQMKFYSKLKIDDTTENYIFENLEKTQINWENYDSEK